MIREDANEEVDLIANFLEKDRQRLEGKTATKVSALQAEDFLREKFLNEPIQFFVVDLEDKPIKGCSFNIPRRQCVLPFLQSLVDRSPVGQDKDGFEIDCVRHATSNKILLPTSMQTECKTLPDTYIIIKRMKRNVQISPIKTNVKEGISCETGTAYCGDYKFLLHNVPLFSESGKLPVLSRHIEQWIIHGVVEQDKRIKKIKESLAVLEKNLATLTRNLSLVKIKTFFDESGRNLQGVQLDEAREMAYSDMSKEKGMLEMKRMGFLKKLEEERDKLSKNVDLTVNKGDTAEERATWIIEFNGLHKDYNESLVLQNKDWTKIHVILSEDSSKCFCVKDMNEAADYMKLEDIEKGSLDLKVVFMERVQDGVGSIFQLSESHIQNGLGSKTDLKNESRQLLFYQGEFCLGKAKGKGFLASDESFFTGQVEDFKPKVGVMTYAGGDVQIGPYKVACSHRQNPYLMPVPHGKVVRSFADGSIYEGEMDHGKFTGHGMYVNALGEEYKGEFLRGLYHGHGRLVTATGDVLEGTFKNGLLHGEAQVSDSYMTFTGNYHLGLREGRGYEAHHNGNKYTGWFQNGFKCGHAKATLSEGQTRKEVEGVWMANMFLSGVRQENDAASTLRLAGSERWTPEIDHQNDKHLQKLRFYEYKQTDEFLRQDLMAAHLQIFRETLDDAKSKLNLEYGRAKGERNVEDKSMPKASRLFFDLRKVLRRPKTVEEACLVPGLLAEMKELSKESTIVGNYKKESFNEEKPCDPVSEGLLGVFEDIELKWKVLDVDRIVKRINELTSCEMQSLGNSD